MKKISKAVYVAKKTTAVSLAAVGLAGMVIPRLAGKKSNHAVVRKSKKLFTVMSNWEERIETKERKKNR